MECHANVPATEGTEEQWDSQDLRYLMTPPPPKKKKRPKTSLFLNERANICSVFVFQGGPGLLGSQGHPGDEGGPVSLNGNNHKQ